MYIIKKKATNLKIIKLNELKKVINKIIKIIYYNNIGYDIRIKKI